MPANIPAPDAGHAAEAVVQITLADAKRIWERARGRWDDDDMGDYFAVSNLHKAIRRAERERAALAARNGGAS